MPNPNETIKTTEGSTLTGGARIRQLAVQQMKWSRWYVNALLEGLTGDQLMHRPGGKGNHPLWVMGHLASSDDQIVSMLSGAAPQLPESFHKLFGGGSEPSDDASDYPTREELVQSMQSAHDRFVSWVEQLDDEAMNAPTPEPLQPFAPDAISAAFSLSAHDLCHAGQISTARASLGLPRVLV